MFRIEPDETFFLPSGHKVRVTLKSTGSSNTNIICQWYLFDPNHASDLSKLGAEALGSHAGDNLNTFFQNGAVASTKTLDTISLSVANAVCGRLKGVRSHLHPLKRLLPLYYPRSCRSRLGNGPHGTRRSARRDRVGVD
jgi:hypothetical protein